MQGQLGYPLKWHHSSEIFPMSSLLGENYPQPPKISLCVHFQLNSPVQNCSKRTPSSAQICHLRSFQKRFFWNTVAKKLGMKLLPEPSSKTVLLSPWHTDAWKTHIHSVLGIEHFSQVYSQTALSCWAVRSFIALNSSSRIWFQSSLTYPHPTLHSRCHLRPLQLRSLPHGGAYTLIASSHLIVITYSLIKLIFAPTNRILVKSDLKPLKIES